MRVIERPDLQCMIPGPPIMPWETEDSNQIKSTGQILTEREHEAVAIETCITRLAAIAGTLRTLGRSTAADHARLAAAAALNCKD